MKKTKINRRKRPPQDRKGPVTVTLRTEYEVAEKLRTICLALGYCKKHPHPSLALLLENLVSGQLAKDLRCFDLDPKPLLELVKENRKKVDK